MEELTQEYIQKLRQAGILNSDETVFLIGDLVVAENVITKERRVLEEAKKLLEGSNKRILKG